MLEYLDNFINYIAVSKSGSKETQVAYYRDISRFIKFIQSEGIEDLADVDKVVAFNYLSAFKSGKITNSKISVTTYNRSLSSLRSFYRYLNRNYDIDTNPFVGIKNPKDEKKLPDFLTFNEIEQMLDCLDEQDEVMLRDKAIISIMYASGLRLQEVSTLLLVNVDFSNSYLKVLGKGNKERIVPFYEEAGEILQLYISKVRSKIDVNNCESVFLNKHGNPLSKRYIEKIVEKVGVMAGINRKVHPHMLRHSFATHLLDNGADLRVVQELLGHENLSTTQIYTHITIDKLKDVIDKSHPRSKNVKKVL